MGAKADIYEARQLRVAEQQPWVYSNIFEIGRSVFSGKGILPSLARKQATHASCAVKGRTNCTSTPRVVSVPVGQRLAVATRRSPYGLDASFKLCSPLAWSGPGFVFRCLGRYRKTRLPANTEEPEILVSYVFWDAFARNERTCSPYDLTTPF